MYSLVFIGAVSFVLVLILTPLARNLCRRFKLFDNPDSSRKFHIQPIPRIGGVPLLASCIGSVACLFLLSSSGGGIIHDALPVIVRFLPGVGLIFIIGLADDIIGLKPWQKLSGQVVAAGAAFWAGVNVQAFGGYHISHWLSLPLTILWLVMCTNAVNLIDGIDGLATGVGLFAAATTLVAALLQNNFGLAAATMPLVGALLGFLRYNFNPATVFLGDSGSLLIGFLLGSYGVIWSQKSATILGMTAPLIALSIPLVDTGLAIVRRFLNNKPIFGADRGHIHHRLMDRGMTARKTVLLLYGLCSLAAVFSLAMSNIRIEGLVLVIFCIVAWIGVQHLGYVELGVVGRMFIEGAFRRHLSAQITLQSHERSLAHAGTPEECWTIVAKSARDFGFCGVRMVLAGGAFDFSDLPEGLPVWEAFLRLSDTEFIDFTRPIDDSPSAAIVAPYVEMLSKTLRPRLEVLAAPRKAGDNQSATMAGA